MRGRIVEINSEGRHLRLSRGFMVIDSKDGEVGRVALDDIGSVIGNAHGMTLTSNLIVALAQRGASVVITGSDHQPVAWLWPVQNHHLQLARMNAQMAASTALKKRLWQEIIKAKITQQAAVLATFGQPSAPLDMLIRRVRAGDPENVEAQAARLYWPMLFGKDFRRERDKSGVNSLLNYGYSVVRSSTAAVVMASGLHPTIALYHSNRGDHFALADDLMEPFRPMVDRTVFALIRGGASEITTETKSKLVETLTHDMATLRGTTPLLSCIERFVQSLAESFLLGKASLDLPLRPLPLELGQ